MNRKDAPEQPNPITKNVELANQEKIATKLAEDLEALGFPHLGFDARVIANTLNYHRTRS